MKKLQLGDNQERLLISLKEHGKMTITAISEITAIKERNVKNIVNEFVELGVLRRDKYSFIDLAKHTIVHSPILKNLSRMA